MDIKPFQEISQSAVVWLNSDKVKEPPQSWITVWNGARERYCTDGAANSLVALCQTNVTKFPTVISGDFDSITQSTLQYFKDKADIKHTPDQDYTDLSKSLSLITTSPNYVNKEIKTVLILGGQSGRFDHTLSAINSILCFQRQTDCKTSIYSVDSTNLTTIVPSKFRITVDRKRITGKCGIVPFCQAETRITTSGFKWNVNNEVMAFGGLISTSNELVEDVVTVDTSAPVILTIELKSGDTFV
ncbi:unnamed protein product [Bursaphelenchus okinawaensis]|uniref:Thiamin pyrophosphokinase thiamin-binding domain-containing protein n=1 Tax=Bursaphelenchus okinawaensis TaxID=465554 RepID=A0A811JS84_9BILA|nr:unnamed protein product [Bursaphelenchus okinawaensis]CAG9080681.1 unnamed protein product [Bursaphelenchus okinawaensis]